MDNIPGDTSRRTPLKKRILEFLDSRTESECIDRLLLTPAQRAGEKADYLLCSRSVICEVKALETNTKDKIDKVIGPLMERDQAPIFYGEWSLDNVAKYFGNAEAEQIRREVFDTVTASIQTLFRKANRQIRTTKELFRLPKAAGCLVLTNDLVPILDPKVLAHKIGELFHKKGSNGELQFPHVEACWIVCETHAVEVSHGVISLPSVLVAPRGRNAAFDSLQRMQPEWADFNGVPAVQMNTDLLQTLRFDKVQRSESKDDAVPRHVLWRRQYGKLPYLRRHSESELKNYFRLLVLGMVPGLLKAGADKQLQSTIRLSEPFTHVLEEANARGIDMKSLLTGAIREDGETIQSGQSIDVTGEEIERARIKRPTMVPGTYYTNPQGKYARCMKRSDRSAKLLVMDMLMGKSLEALIEVDEQSWSYFWPILDEQLLVALESRFSRLSAQHPDLIMKAGS